jgi:predicted transcriptional regulator
MQEKTLLLSIHPQYAGKIFEGMKTVELRRVKPRLSKGDIVLVYVTSPKMELTGAFEVSGVIKSPPKDLWPKVADCACIDKDSYDRYFSGANHGYGIKISYSWKFKKPLSLSSLRQEIEGFNPPQGYKYYSASEITHHDMGNLLLKPHELTS